MRFLIIYHSNDGRWKDVLSRHCEPYQKKGELEVAANYTLDRKNIEKKLRGKISFPCGEG